MKQKTPLLIKSQIYPMNAVFYELKKCEKIETSEKGKRKVIEPEKKNINETLFVYVLSLF